jgi:ubiquinone/menaquinone biosynthesis C-methylase UbiE
MGEPELLYAADYFLAVAGLAVALTWLTSPALARPRVDDIRRIVEHFGDFPQSLELTVREHSVEDGYTRWAPKYDGPNPAIAVEEPVVHAILADAPRGVALDAACGTGRHAQHLASLGYEVIGVDATDAMLDVARKKLPGSDLRSGTLEALPVDDASVDVVTCALALTHVPALVPVYAEFARVLRPGGWLVTSDMHPFVTMVGGGAVFPTDHVTDVSYVPNLVHQVSEYVDAMHAAGLVIERCVEPRAADTVIEFMPAFLAYPDATRQAFAGLPYLLVWVATKPGYV